MKLIINHKIINLLAPLLLSIAQIHAIEYHVATSGKNTNAGTVKKPFRTIQYAADKAQAGDTIIIHAGIYRERIDPPRGGISNEKRITYKAADNAKVVIKGSEVVTNWEKHTNQTWKTTVSNAVFGDYNPFATQIAGDWFTPLPVENKHPYHTGSVYLNGHWLKEARSFEDVSKPLSGETLWFAIVGERDTTIYAQFDGVDPNQELTEINVRESVFYPSKRGINYISVIGLTMEHAAPNWAPPTAEQVGLIGTHWSKGWVIKDNIIRYSICTGVTLGKYGDQWDNTSEDSAEGYVETIKRALKNGWSKEKIGSHLVENNHVSHCEQAGIIGSMGAAFSVITGNQVNEINTRNMLGGAEMAGMKFHGAVDTIISHNHVFRCHGFGGIWLDWMTQGTRMTGNLLHSNKRHDLFLEVNHGPFLIDNNIFLSPSTIQDQSTGGAYVHNIIGGEIGEILPQTRETPYLTEHGTSIVGLQDNQGGDNRYINNLFVNGSNLDVYKNFENMLTRGNTFSDTTCEVVVNGKNTLIKFEKTKDLKDQLKGGIVTSDDLGRTQVSKLLFKQPDGKKYRIDKDYLKQTRSKEGLRAGAFQSPISTQKAILVWPKK